MNRDHRRPIPPILATGLLLFTASAAMAQTAPPGEVVVTATRLPASLAETPDAYVVDRQDIEARQITFAAQALQTVPGLSVFSNGMFGVTSVRQRGASSDETLVLVDGVPVNDPSQPAGSFDFSGLDLADVTRIEVLSGPQASLWGSDAIGGVIAFTTAEPGGVRADLETGSFGTVRASASVGRSTDRWALGVSAADVSSNGVSAADVRNDYTAFGLPGLRNSEADGAADWTMGARGRLNPAGWIELDAQVRYASTHIGIDGYPPPDFVFSDTNDISDSRSVLAVVRARIDGPFGLKSEISVSGYHLDRGQNGQSGDFGYTADREVYRWTVAKGALADPVSAEAGVEREDGRASLSTGDTADLGATSAFAVVRVKPVAALTATASLRYDDPDRYAGQTTGRIAADYDLGGGFSLQASAGQGFKTPTISETVCDFCFPAGPSVGLRPEHAEGYDAGVGWRSTDGRVSVRATVFALNVRDQISYVNGRYINIARTRSTGLELEGEAALGGGFRLEASYSHTDAVDADTGARELRVPLDSGSASLFWRGGRVDAALSVRTEASQADTDLDGFSPVTRPGFAVADLTAGYALNDHVRLTARIENLADTHYQEVYGFGEPGRAIYVGVRLKD
jgi:vitamin B12 transporter